VNTRQLQFKTNAFPRTRVSQYWLCAVFGAGMLFSALSVADEVKVAVVKPAAGLTASKQSLAVVKSKVAEFLTMQTIGYPGEVSVQVGAIDPNLRLAACDDSAAIFAQWQSCLGQNQCGRAVPSAK
jgi:hypothetical protein